MEFPPPLSAEAHRRVHVPNLVWLSGFRKEITGVPRSQETPLLWDPTVGLCLGPYGAPRGLAFSYERGTPAGRMEFPLPLSAKPWLASMGIAALIPPSRKEKSATLQTSQHSNREGGRPSWCRRVPSHPKWLYKRSACVKSL